MGASSGVLFRVCLPSSVHQVDADNSSYRLATRLWLSLSVTPDLEPAGGGQPESFAGWRVDHEDPVSELANYQLRWHSNL